MQFRTSIISFVLACSIAIITTLFLSLAKVSVTALFIVAVMSFSSAFVLTYVSFEFLFLKEIHRLYKTIGEIDQELKNRPHDSPSLGQIKKDIENYAFRKEQEIAALKKMEIFRREFIANISHELKTPLFAAQGFILTLLDGAIDDRKVRLKFLRKAAKSLDGLNILVQELLTLSQIESGDIIMQYEIFDIQELTHEIFDQFEDKAQKRSIVLEVESPYEGGIFVNADEKRIRQVLTNLIVNAIKYTNENCRVWVKFELEAQWILISVNDNGSGIPAEHHERIFERFYRVDKSRNKKQGGSGLGLAIVKHIVERHNSQITVSSIADQKTSFTFRLERG